MPCMPEIVAKGAIMRKLDAVMNDPVSRKRLKDNLNNPNKQFVEAGDDVYAAFWEDMLSPAEKTHLELDWFRPLDKGGWWCIEDGVVEKVMRRGLLTLIDKADECCARWVDCYWVCAFQHNHNCHVYVGDFDDDFPFFVTTPAIDSGWLLRNGKPPQVMFPGDPMLEKLEPKHVVLEPDEPDPGDIPSIFWPWWNGRWKKMKECAEIKERQPECEEGLDRVECSITWSHAQITFCVHTPPPPNGYGPGSYMDYPEPIEVVKWDRASNAIKVSAATWMGYEYK